MGASCKKFCVNKLCKERKACACQCEGAIGGTNPTMLEACLGDCWNDPYHLSQYESVEQYLCGCMDPQQLYNHHGYLCPGFDPLQGTAQGEAYAKQQGNIDQSKKVMIIVVLVLLAMLGLVFYYYLKGRKKA